MDSPHGRAQIPARLVPELRLPFDPILLTLTAAVPLLIGAWRASARDHDRVGGAAALLGGALASLVAATGGLELAAWRGYAAAVPGGSTFIAAGAGAAIAAAAVAPGGGVVLLAALPFSLLILNGLRTILWSPATALGAGVVVALLAIGLGVGRSRGAAVAREATPWPAREQLMALAATLAVIVGAPVVLILLGVVVVAWRVHASVRSRGWWAIPTATTVLASVLGWLLLTVAGTPLVPLRTVMADVPLSAAAERLVGNLWVVLVAVLAGAWPLARGGLSLRTAPIAVALGVAGVTMVSPDGIAAWRPLTTMVMVPCALLAAARRDRAGLAGALAAVVSLAGSPLALASALLLLVAPLAHSWRGGNLDRPHRVTLHVTRVGRVTSALGLASALLVLLPTEVVLGTALAAGLGLILPMWGPPADAA